MTLADPVVADGLLAIFCVGCVVTDVREQKIYNVWTVPFFLLALAYAGLGGPTAPADSALGAGLGFVVLLPFFALGGVGAGDAKMLMVLGALGGARFLGVTCLGAGLAAGALSLAVAAYDCRRLGGWATYMAITQAEVTQRVTRAQSQRSKAPLGVAIAAGALWARLAPLVGP